MHGQRRTQLKNVRCGNPVFRTDIRIVVGDFLGQSPRNAVVARIVQIVFARTAVACAKRDVEISPTVEAIVYGGRYAFRYLPV